MECEKNPITTETLIIKKTIGSLFKLILKNLYSKITENYFLVKTITPVILDFRKNNVYLLFL